MTKIIYLTIFILLNVCGYAQIKIGGSGRASQSVMLELESNNRSFLPPRVNLTSTLMALDGGIPADGMVVYSTNSTTGLGLFCWYNGKWNKMSDTSSVVTASHARFNGADMDPDNNSLRFTVESSIGAEGSSPMFLRDASRIQVTASGLYLISASYRVEGTVVEHDIQIVINDDYGKNTSFARFPAGGTGSKTLTSTSVLYLNSNDYISVKYLNVRPVVGYGTTQLSVWQVPLTY